MLYTLFIKTCAISQVILPHLKPMVETDMKAHSYIAKADTSLTLFSFFLIGIKAYGTSQ